MNKATEEFIKKREELKVLSNLNLDTKLEYIINQIDNLFNIIDQELFITEEGKIGAFVSNSKDITTENNTTE